MSNWQRLVRIEPKTLYATDVRNAIAPGAITLDMVRQARVEHELMPWMRMFAEQGDV